MDLRSAFPPNPYRTSTQQRQDQTPQEVLCDVVETPEYTGLEHGGKEELVMERQLEIVAARVFGV
jgi:hypothetical protein